jgi:hypothetical protein
LSADLDGFSLAVEEEAGLISTPITGGLVWELPGHGESLPSCGEVRFRGHRAVDEVHLQRFKFDCQRFVCPVCPGYVRRAAHAIEDQLLSWLPAHRPAVHATVSPPQDATGQLLGGRSIGSHGSYSMLRREARAALQARGFKRGCLIFHPFRISKPGIRFTCSAGPHFHALGEGEKTNLGIAYARDGWVGKYLGSRKRIYRTAVYILSHAGRAAPAIERLESGRLRSVLEVVTWFGYKRGERRAPERSEGVYCTVCEVTVPLREWFELIWEGSGPPPEADDVAEFGEWRAVVHDRTTWPPIERDITGSVFVDLEPEWDPPRGRRRACLFCRSNWKRGDGELRCAHLEEHGGMRDRADSLAWAGDLFREDPCAYRRLLDGEGAQ